MWPDRVSTPGPLAHESDALPTALRGPAYSHGTAHDKNSIMEKIKQKKHATIYCPW